MPKASRNPTQRPRSRERSEAQRSIEPRTGRDVAERILSIGVVAFVAIAVLGFAATMLHIGLRDTVPLFASVAWQYAYWLPLLALPAAIVCLVALVLVSAAGKARRRR
ncbi:hypothetical protein [Agrococcus sp. DT81.2]|uniref:hypothetical protein n=1 Tax=Agrococcus sp. DT81.2 TaxID=3393414 RepID=UPI003CE49024